jgi:hypothetical protein
MFRWIATEALFQLNIRFWRRPDDEETRLAWLELNQLT